LKGAPNLDFLGGGKREKEEGAQGEERKQFQAGVGPKKHVGKTIVGRKAGGRWS